MINIKGLNKYFNKGKQNEIHVINGVDLTLPDRGMVAIFGKSGCGKTTLLNVIGGLDKFASGSITVDGQSIRENTDIIRNKYIGYIFQNYNLNKGVSCFDNVADALRLCGMDDEAEIERRTLAALANVDMEKYAKRPPDTLSGGQQQRIAIARAIVKNPKIILADEPTGNLDEINTVMIMDLLKEISKDHLVLLVTHEANLVDYYCDTVIELQDGRVVDIKNNDSANGYITKDKNHIYLGELEKSELGDGNAKIEYYGDCPENPIELKIVNSGGKMYIEINTPGVTVLDRTSEVKLKEGVFEEKPRDIKERDGKMDMSALPPIDGKRFGRLFSFLSSIKSGYTTNFKNKSKKKGKKTLIRCLSMFAIVLVIMSTVLGGAFEELINANSSYNHNVFYLYTPDGEVSDKLMSAVGDGESGIDYIRLHYGYSFGDESLQFAVNSFETFSTSMFDTGLSTNGVFLSRELAEELELVAGKKDGLGENDLLITTAMADKLLEKSSVGYIEEYKDLIGLETSGGYYIYGNGDAQRIAGIVESDETAIYVDELVIAKRVISNGSYFVELDSDWGNETEKGHTTLLVYYYDETEESSYPEKGEVITVGGIELTVNDVIYHRPDYSSWLEYNGIAAKSEEEYINDIITKDYPSSDNNTTEYAELFNKVQAERHFDYLDYYYSHYSEFMKIYGMFEGEIETWMYNEKGVIEVMYSRESADYYKAVKYKEITGKYPLFDETFTEVTADMPDVYEVLKSYCISYENEFYNGEHMKLYTSTYLIDESDYISLSKRVGDSHETTGFYEDFYTDDYYVYDNFIGSSIVAGELDYTLIHSTDPQKTSKWLESEFSDLNTGFENSPAIIDPDHILEDILRENSSSIVASLVSMAVVLAIMSICMYFIMRSSLMVRIKEVGIYRAIGVSKKNLIFKFAVESAVLTTLTVFVGYILSSGFIGICHYLSPLAKEVMYYPLPMALIILFILYVLCLFCGTLPIATLLRKTPSEILAKYDI